MFIWDHELILLNVLLGQTRIPVCFSGLKKGFQFSLVETEFQFKLRNIQLKLEFQFILVQIRLPIYTEKHPAETKIPVYPSTD